MRLSGASRAVQFRGLLSPKFKLGRRIAIDFKRLKRKVEESNHE
jgi:hypothetical protein